MMETAPPTRGDWVYAPLKHAIVSGELPPGSRLVVAAPAPISVAEAEEVYPLRLVLEPWALRGSLAQSDGAHRAEVAAAHARLVEVVSHLPAAEERLLLEAHRAFHAVLLACCPSVWLRRLSSLLADHSQRYQLPNVRYAQRVSDSTVRAVLEGR